MIQKRNCHRKTWEEVETDLACKNLLEPFFFFFPEKYKLDKCFTLQHHLTHDTRKALDDYLVSNLPNIIGWVNAAAYLTKHKDLCF